MKYPITPVAKPRKFIGKQGWQIRKNHPKYWAFIDECTRWKISVPIDNGHIIFTIPMAKSWSKKKKAEMDGEYCRQKPDLDNLCKAILDAAYKEDSIVADIRLTKVWGYTGSIEIL